MKKNDLRSKGDLMKVIVFGFLLLLGSPIAIIAQSDNFAFNKSVFDKGNMAYVVIGASNNNPPNGDRITYNTFRFKNNKTKKVIVLKVDGVQSFLIPPGDYTFIELHLSNYVKNAIGWLSVRYDKSQIEGSFSVSAGEAVYLGHISTNIIRVASRGVGTGINQYSQHNKDEFSTNITDNFDNIEKAKFESECGKALTPKIMTWNKLR